MGAPFKNTLSAWADPCCGYEPVHGTASLYNKERKHNQAVEPTMTEGSLENSRESSQGNLAKNL